MTLSGTTNHLGAKLALNSATDIVNNAGTYNMTGGTIDLNGSTQFNNTGTFDVDMDGEPLQVLEVPLITTGLSLEAVERAH